MNNLGLQACPKFHINPTWLNLSISQENVVPFKHHAYFYEVLELSRLESNLQKSRLEIHKPLAFWPVTFAARVFLSAEYSTTSEYQTNNLQNNGQKVKGSKVLLLNPLKTYA